MLKAKEETSIQENLLNLGENWECLWSWRRELLLSLLPSPFQNDEALPGSDPEENVGLSL